MSLTIRPMRYAHCEGHTDICFTDNGRHMITGGSEGDIRIWAGIDDDEPESHCVGEKVFSVVQKKDYIYVSTDDNKILILKYPNCEREGLLVRFAAPATHIAVAKDKDVFACVSEDLSAKVLNLPQDTNASVFKELTGPGISVAISNDGKFLVAASGDGNMYVWNVETKELVKTIDCVPHTSSFGTTKLLCRPSFDPKSKFLAYPYHKEVFIVETVTFKKVCILKDDDIRGSLSIVQFSPCGKYIAASSQNGEVCVWHYQSKTFVGLTQNPEKQNICSMHWNPQDNGEIVFCDVTGQIGMIDVSTSDEIMTEIVAEEQDNDEIIQYNFDNDNDDDENVISLEKLKNETLRPGSANSIALSSSEKGSRGHSPERARTPPVNIQQPFQPGSTPAHLEQRFLAYNEFGIIQAFNDGDPSIDIQFHDVNVARNTYMKNVLNHTMGSLSSKVVALACETPSKLVCIPTEASNKQWTTEMSDLEEILCVTASVNLVAVATDTRFLRVFSIYGTQMAVLSIPGPIVALSSHKNYILAVFHASVAYSKDQNLTSMLIQFEGLNIKSKTLPIPLTPGATLTWLGFTDQGSIVTYDSSGILRQYHMKNNFWFPIFDASTHAKGASDTYFITSISEASQIVYAIHCKGSIYPQTTPRPILIELPMQSLMCELSTDKSTLEEKLFRWSNTSVVQPENTFKEAVIKLFVIACRSELDERALELLSTIGSSQLTNLGLKYANRLNRKRLVEKLADLLNFLEGKENEDKENEEEEEPEPHSTESVTRESQIVTQDFTQSPQIKTPDILFSKTQKAGNPFLKKAADTQVKKNPLGLTDVTASFENSPSTSKSADKGSEESFMDWFARSEATLVKNYPNMEKKELIQLGMKLFKKIGEKRKQRVNDDDGDGNKKKQPKLSDFAFKK